MPELVCTFRRAEVWQWRTGWYGTTGAEMIGRTLGDVFAQVASVRPTMIDDERELPFVDSMMDGTATMPSIEDGPDF